MIPDLTLPELEQLLLYLVTLRMKGGLSLSRRVKVFSVTKLVSDEILSRRKEQRDCAGCYPGMLLPPADYDGPWAG